MSRERELLKRVLKHFDETLRPLDKAILTDSIREFLSIPETERDEPVDISDKSEPTVAAILPNGVRVTNVHDAYIAGMFEGSGLAKLKAEQDEEPVGWVAVHKEDGRSIVEKFKDMNHAYWATQTEWQCAPLYLHPAPRKPFVRLSDEEIMDLWFESSKTPPPDSLIVFARAVEDALEEKNK